MQLAAECCMFFASRSISFFDGHIPETMGCLSSYEAAGKQKGRLFRIVTFLNI